MESFGEIVDLIVLRCKQSQKGKGCGFCTFASRESALKAIDELHGKHIFAEMKNPLQVKFAHAESSIQQQSAKLFVGQLPKSVDEGALSAAFEEYGTIVECQILRRGKDSRGCGFVRLDGRNEAEAAVEGLNGAFVFNGQNSPLNVRFAANSREKQQRRQAKRKEKGIRSQMANMPVMTPYQGSAAYSQEMAMTYPYIQMTAMDQMHNMQMLQYVGMRHLPTAMGMGM
uniref:RRM domain-containing protein n=1 Tax=Rhodosorus marinus TaxID=101924 RepID=A0A7S2ZYZ7_9RHOD|mmetsp:Transcript_38297/g.151486  ORF Transcript_38297/g.151486 Transcript_38297/m.151486 type:complete len:228 (+) Transcript_38297:713-1396(+)